MSNLGTVSQRSSFFSDANNGQKLKLLAARREAADAELSRLIEEAAKKRRERMELVAELREINNKSFKAIRQEREFWRNQLKSLKKQLVGSNDDKGKESKVKMKNFDSEEWSTAAWNSDAELENLVKASKSFKKESTRNTNK
ncbi:hypothetical protein QR680_012178 [Steinernema hermaphroditum]|uniref:Uncharacterized protein n=1 Tax=Steinernema hermaphroditum TaxID=289476 RepID=A0AA39M0B8_9BILA|nr:hypothetical protein QR680_012178 [Steinernema hermaphroditum]